MMMKVVIPAKAGIQIENTGFRIKSGTTKCLKFFLKQYTSYLFKIFLAYWNLNIQHIFPWGECADKLFIIGAGGLIGHIKIQHHLILW